MFQSDDDYYDIISEETFTFIDKNLEQQKSETVNKTQVLEEKAHRLIAKLNGCQGSEERNASLPARQYNIPNSIFLPKDSNETPSKIKRKRKFPGPAGLLPENFEESSNDKARNVPLSQSFPNSQNLVSSSVFDEAPWLTMVEDTKGIRNHTIVNIKQMALEHRLVGRKVPILAGVVQNVDRTLPDPLLVLRDQTDEIQCTLHRDAWECLACHLVPHYSVIVLKNSTIFTTGTALKKIYLNITNNNVLSVYCDEENVFSVNPNVLKSSRSDISKIYSEEIITKDDSRVIVLKNLHLDKGYTCHKAGNNISSLLQSTKSVELENTTSNDIIAQTYLDDIQDEFISQEFL